jgi:hypothetical protein
MFAAYTGNLFQLTRASDSTTINVGSMPTGLYNAATVASFCVGTSCYISNIYDQAGNANHLPQATVASMAPWALYPSNTLPVVVTYTIGGAFYRNRASTTGIPTGAASTTTYMVRAMDVWGSCCGEYGRLETTIVGSPAGAMWTLGYQLYPGTTPGLGVDFEGTDSPIQPGTIPLITGYIDKYNSATNLFTDKYVDVTTSPATLIGLQQNTPPQTPIVQAGLSLGEGGDASAAPTEFFEGAVITGVTSDATDAALSQNLAAFYSTKPTMALGPVDTIINSGVCGGALCANGPKPAFTGAVGGAWGFRRMWSGYTGYAANIRRASDSTTIDIGFSNAGDFDDIAARQFCAGTTCFVAKLYNQALAQSSNDPSHSLLDEVQATTAKQPQVIFADVNGRTAMRGTGTQYLCTAGTPVGLGQTWGLSAVANRTGGTGAITGIIGANGNQGTLEYPAASNSVSIGPGSTGTKVTVTAADSTWHAILGQTNYLGDTNGSVSVQADGGAAITNGGNAAYAFLGTTWSLMSESFGALCATSNLPMTGDLAEAMVISLGTGKTSGGMQNHTPISTAQATALYQNQRNYYGLLVAPSAVIPVYATGYLSTGTKFTTTGCSISATTGGASAGTFTLGANACTAIVTMNGATGMTAPTGWTCQANDRTAPTVLIGGESSSTTTTASFTIPAGAGATDVISFSCTGF